MCRKRSQKKTKKVHANRTEVEKTELSEERLTNREKLDNLRIKRGKERKPQQKLPHSCIKNVSNTLHLY